MKKYKLKDRIISFAMAVIMVITILPLQPITAHAEETDTTVCIHHVHNEECGYTAPAEEMPCTHTHDESCGFIPAVTEVLCECADTDENGAILHAENCGYTPAAEEVPCTHTHDGNCGYAAAVAGTPCNWTVESCAECSSMALSATELTVGCAHRNATYEWKDGDSHYMDCPDCEDDCGIGHSGDGTCLECGYITHTHTAGADGKCTYLIGEKVCGLCAHTGELYYLPNEDMHQICCNECNMLLGEETHTSDENGYCAACGDCSHANATYTWENETGHYVNCPGCEDDLSAQHDFDNGTCLECGYITHTHTVGADGKCTFLIGGKECGLCTHINQGYVYDTSDHWLACLDCIYPLGNMATHDFSEGNKCSVCSYVKQCLHENAEYYWENESTHYMNCPDCEDDGYIWHNPDETCNNCGYIPHTHIAGEDGNCIYIIGGTECGLCAHSGDKDYEKHTDEEHEVYCGICDILLYAEAHTPGEDGYCKYCGECSHQGDKDYEQYQDDIHNVYCDICGEWLMHEDHIFGEDGYCKYCGECSHSGDIYYIKYSYDEHEVDCAICNAWLYDEAHTPGENGYCKYCGECAHPNAIYAADNSEYHVKYCADCKKHSEIKETHNWGSDFACTDCGYILHQHSMTTFQYDDIHNHVKHCTVDNCYYVEYEAHNFETGTCPGCNSPRPKGVYVAGKLLTDGDYIDNSGNVGNTQPASGYAHYAGGRLTLNNFVFSGEGYVKELNDDTAICTFNDVEIVLTGESTLHCTTGVVITAIFSDITFSGEGSIKLTSGVPVDGLYIEEGNLVINGGNIVIDVYDDGIQSYTDVENKGLITINGGTLDITTGDDDGIDGQNRLIINGGTVKVNSNDKSIENYGDITVTGGILYLTSKTDDGIDAGENVNITGGYMKITAAENGIICDGKTDISGGNILIESGYSAVSATDGITVSGKAEIVNPANTSIKYIEDGYYSYCIVDENEAVVENAEIVSHRHDWKYTAEGATITITCKNTDNDCYDTDGGRLTAILPENTAYTGLPIEVTVKDEINGAIVPEYFYEPSDSLTNGLPVNAGEYTFVLRAGDAEVRLGYTITPATVTYTAPEANDLVYTGTAQQLVTEGTASNGTMYYSLDGENWRTDVPTGESANTYTVWYKITADENYADVAASSVDVTIYEKQLTVIGATAASKEYDGTRTATIEEITLSGIVTGDDVSATATAQFADKNIGTYKIVTVTGIVLTGSDATNYTVDSTYQTTANITPAPITVTVEEGLSKVYGEADPTIGYTIREVDKWYESEALVVSRESGEDAGSYAYRVDEAAYPNYDIILVAFDSFEIAKATPDFTAPTGLTGVYGDTLEKIELPTGFSWTDNTLILDALGEKEFTVTYTPADTLNYNTVVDIPVKVDVTRRPVTLKSAQAAGPKIYDGTTKGTVTGVQLENIFGNDDVTAIATAEYDMPDAMFHSWVTITVTGLTGEDADKYYLDGSNTYRTTTSVSEAPITVKPNTHTKIYGETDPEITYTITEGKLYGDDELTGALGREEGENVGKYAYTIGSLNNFEYEIKIDTTNMFEITQATPDLSGVQATIPDNSTSVADIQFTGAKGVDGNALAGEFAMTSTEPLVWGENTVEFTFTPADTANYKTVTGTATVTVTDTIAPTGKVMVEENSWIAFLNSITFDKLFNKTVDVTVTAGDELSGIKSVEYIESSEALTLEAVKAATGWTSMGADNKVSVTAEDAKQFVYYIRITDKAGNVTIISTDGAIYDLTSPVIGGITDDATYYTTQRFTVTDAHLDYVKVNDSEVTEFVLPGDREETYVIYAMDKVGNHTEITVTMKTIDKIDDGIENLTEDIVTLDDKAAVDEVKAVLDSVDENAATEEEKELLKNIRSFVDGLDKVIEETKKAVDNATSKPDYEDVTPDNVTSDNKADIEDNIAEIKDILAGNTNLTDEQKERLEEVKSNAETLLDEIEDNTEVMEKALKAADTITGDNYKPEDKTALEDAGVDLLELLNSENYTESEQEKIADELNRVTMLITDIEEIEAVDKAIDDADAAQKDKNAEDIPGDQLASDMAIIAKEKFKKLDDRQRELLGEDAINQLEELYIKVVAFKIIHGADGTWTQGTTSTLGFTANGMFKLFETVRVDGNILVKDTDYTAMSGSTIVTLTKSYLDTLSVGEHKLEVVYEVLGIEYIADCNFTIKESPAPQVTPPPTGNVPATGDTTNVVEWTGIMLSSMVALAVVLKKRKEYE